MATATCEKTGQARAASSVNAVLGLWLIISPWVYGFAGEPGSAWNSIIVGAIIALFGILRASTPGGRQSLSWINLVLGAWTAISPWIYGYADNGGRLWNSLIVGIVIAALAVWSGSATAAAHRQAHA